MPTNEYPNLSKPPIQMVIFQIGYVDNYHDFPPDTGAFDPLINLWLPTKQKHVNTNIDLDNSDANQPKVKVGKTEINGLTYSSLERSKILSITKDRFSLTINNTYSDWDEYIHLFRQLWTAYRSAILSDGLTIARCSARFINRILITDMVTPADYFNTTIYAEANVIPGVVNTFLMKYTSHLKEEHIQVDVTQGFEPQIGNVSPYIFDIDVISIQQFDDNNLWATFSKLRSIKNQVFFGNLTDKTKNQLT